jgi:hypothetical protein
MAAAGIFAEDDRVELIDGEVRAMSPIGPRHASCVTSHCMSSLPCLRNWKAKTVQTGGKVALSEEP